MLLVPGYGGSTAGLAVLARRIRATGRAALVIRLPGNGTGSLTRYAGVLNQAVNRALRDGAPSVDVIGYSAGGVTALLWAREDDGDRKARRVVTLGSPFHGTAVATAAQGLAPSACPTACVQLIPGSRLLAGLAAGVPARLPWLSLWTTDDQTVTPPASARLAGAIDVPVQSVCPAPADQPFAAADQPGSGHHGHPGHRVGPGRAPYTGGLRHLTRAARRPGRPCGQLVMSLVAKCAQAAARKTAT